MDLGSKSGNIRSFSQQPIVGWKAAESCRQVLPQQGQCEEAKYWAFGSSKNIFSDNNDCCSMAEKNT